MGQVEAFPDSAPRRPLRLMDRMRSELRVRHYSIRTEEAYTSWVRRSIQFHRRHPRDLDGDDLNWKWQYVFPAGSRGTDPRSGIERRHHLHESVIRKAGGRGVTSPADTLGTGPWAR